jgi:acyl-[acyl-carrier-protein]-phospholipid O-acyltransferase/long-chain-fatty-acid--[acyl-carrier-protein] ligase
VSTPTFLQSFIKRCPAEQFKTLDFVICGAEKLPARVRDAYREKFGTEPIEGYGATECSPALSTNIPDFPVPGHNVVQIGNRPGTVGRPLPGITLRVVDPDTGELLDRDQPGLLKVKGPNIMRGYLGMPEKTAQVLHDGWYETGDIVRVDEDGFIAITDRLARFSKIAGEMVPHTNVEEALHGLLGLTEQALAVAGVPDTSRGERIVVLHTLDDGQIQALLERLTESDMPSLWRPKPSSFHRIPEIPVLGTGKMDIKAVRAMALEMDQGE